MTAPGVGALDPRTVARLRVTEADLILGVIMLDEYRREGVERAAEELRRIVRSVEPDEFSAGLSALWCGVRKLHAAGEAITLEKVVETASAWWPRDALERTVRSVTDLGMPLGWSARKAAERLLSVSDARQRHARALQEAADALECIRTAVLGVTA